MSDSNDSTQSDSTQNVSSNRQGVQNRDGNTESMAVLDRSGRRQFIRQGAAFVAAGSLVTGVSPVYADDCDRAQEGEKNAQAPGSDSDAGASADPTGCGRNPEPPKISRGPDTLNTERVFSVEKIKA